MSDSDDLTDEEIQAAARKMTYILLAGPEAWQQIKPKLVTAEVIPKFRALAETAPERMELSFIQHVHAVAHRVIDHWAAEFELWALMENRPDLYTALSAKLEEAERQAEEDG